MDLDRRVPNSMKIKLKLVQKMSEEELNETMRGWAQPGVFIYKRRGWSPI